jgi:hypothetical protein
MGNHLQKQGLERISFGSQFTIPDTAGTTPNPGANHTDMRSSKPNQASHTPDMSYPLVSSVLFSSSSPSLFLAHNYTIIAQYKVKSFISISPSDDRGLPPSIAYTEYCLHRVQYPCEIFCLRCILTMES